MHMIIYIKLKFSIRFKTQFYVFFVVLGLGCSIVVHFDNPSDQVRWFLYYILNY